MTDSHEATLASMALDKNCIAEVAAIITGDMFPDYKHRFIWSAIIALHDRNFAIDFVTIRDELGDSLEQAGGTEYIIRICELVPSSASAMFYARLVLEAHKKAEIGRLASDITRIANGKGTSTDLINEADKAFRDRTESNIKAEVMHLKDIECSFDLEVNEYLPTQFPDLNSQIIGFGKTALVAVIGSTGMGKSSLMLDLLLHFGYNQNLPCALFSCELTNKENKQRLCCNLSDKSYKAVLQGYCSNEDKEYLYESARQLATKPIFLDKTPGLTSAELRRKLMALHRREGIKVAFVDHLHRMKMPKGSEGRRQGLAQIAREIKDLATELEIPIVLGAQVNRECSREKRRPTMYDIRDCGEVEENCDLILAPFRPSHYGLGESDVILELKGRNCGKGECEVLFNEGFSSFRNPY